MCATLAFSVATVNVEAATSTQRAAFLAAKARPTVQDVAGNGPIFLFIGDIPTPDDFVEIHSQEDADDADEYAYWLTLTPEQLAQAKADYAAQQALDDAAEAALLASMTRLSAPPTRPPRSPPTPSRSPPTSLATPPRRPLTPT